MHVVDSLTQELKTLTIEEKQTVDDITDRIVELEKALVLLQITIHSKHGGLDKKNREKTITR